MWAGVFGMGTLWTTLFVLILSRPVFAELTLQEKEGVRKIATASFVITESINEFTGSPTNALTAKRSLFVAIALLLHAPSSVLRNEPMDMPRDDVVDTAFMHIDQAIGLMSKYPTLGDAVAVLESVDRTLAYADPLGGIFALQDDQMPGGDPEPDETQFGPHGSYTNAQRMLTESSRLLNYGQFQMRQIGGTYDLTAFNVAIQKAQDCMLRVLALSGHVSVHSADDGIADDDVLRALKEISLGQDLCAAINFGNAMREVSQALVVSASNPYVSTALTGSKNLAAAWVRLHSWTDSFLQITEVPIP